MILHAVQYYCIYKQIQVGGVISSNTGTKTITTDHRHSYKSFVGRDAVISRIVYRYTEVMKIFTAITALRKSQSAVLGN